MRDFSGVLEKDATDFWQWWDAFAHEIDFIPPYGYAWDAADLQTPAAQRKSLHLRDVGMEPDELTPGAPVVGWLELLRWKASSTDPDAPRCRLWLAYKGSVRGVDDFMDTLEYTIQARWRRYLLLDVAPAPGGATPEPAAAPANAQEREERGPTETTRQRAEVFRKLKDAHPEWNQSRVAMEANEQEGWTDATESTVRNCYRAMGWKWERADRIR